MEKAATIRPMADHLFLIQLPVPIVGFEEFITTWVYTGGPVVLIDVGPSSCKDSLLAALDDIGVQHLDWILLTHIHIDHSGAIGDIAHVFPTTPVVCHRKAAEHLIGPQRLWEGSLKTLGDVAQLYGPIAGVPEAQVLTVDRLDAPEIVAVDTPGHAAHHCSYMLGDLLFAGEAGGVCVAVGQDEYYLRPATPPRFIMEIYLASIDRLIALRPQKICYGHVGMHPDAVAMLHAHRDQLQRWHRMVKPCYEADPAANDDTLSACLDFMLNNDPSLSLFSRLPIDARERERFFLRNSLRGYWGYLRDKASGR
jgi:glyoxylase-like metal-dependent hydrolase (beta-lactamase superfamily II)